MRIKRLRTMWIATANKRVVLTDTDLSSLLDRALEQGFISYVDHIDPTISAKGGAK